MHIIALGWIYVVLMMAIFETSITAGIMTFTMYCAIPLGLLWYLTKGKRSKTSPNNITAPHNNDLKIQQHDSTKTVEKMEPKN
jgi:uncharacterized membrane protein YfbV (UPF0208 family)